MAWPFSGNFEKVSLGDMPEIMSAMCAAANQRLELKTGQTTAPSLTLFRYGDGSNTKLYPTANDFDDTFSNGLNSASSVNVMNTNIRLIRLAIQEMVTYELEQVGETIPPLPLFVKSASEVDGWPQAFEAISDFSINQFLDEMTSFGEDWIGEETPLSPPSLISDFGIQDGRIWEQLKEAFDALIYLRFGSYYGGIRATEQVGEEVGPSPTTWEPTVPQGSTGPAAWSHVTVPAGANIFITNSSEWSDGTPHKTDDPNVVFTSAEGYGIKKTGASTYSNVVSIALGSMIKGEAVFRSLNTDANPLPSEGAVLVRVTIDWSIYAQNTVSNVDLDSPDGVTHTITATGHTNTESQETVEVDLLSLWNPLEDDFFYINGFELSTLVYSLISSGAWVIDEEAYIGANFFNTTSDVGGEAPAGYDRFNDNNMIIIQDVSSDVDDQT